MKNLLSKFYRQAGFTMIELLIVISILGILAVAVLSAINPIEQINRGRDTGSQSDAEQLIGAMDRFYAFSGYYPWQTGVNVAGEVDLQAWVQFEDTLLVDQGGTCPLGEKLSTAVTAGCTGSEELKQSFIDRLSNPSSNALYVYNAGTIGSSTYVCFEPQSSAFVQAVLTKYDGSDGSTKDGIIQLTEVPADYPFTNAVNTAVCGSPTGNCTCLP